MSRTPFFVVWGEGRAWSEISGCRQQMLSIYITPDWKSKINEMVKIHPWSDGPVDT
jgi:hypothetical protein